MKNFCIISNQDKDTGLKVANFVAEEIAKRGGNAKLLSTNEAAKAKGEGFTDLSGITDDTEGIIIIGGDGTMIQAARELVRFDLPIIGIDLGTLGYLAEVEPDDIEDALDRLFSGEYHIEERMLLEGTVITEGKESYKGHALNDIVLGRSGFSRIITVKVKANDQLLGNYRGDGIIIATPTGSTAYNLSAGGPILLPNAGAFAITPICPHSLDMRSVVVSATDEINITVMQSKKSQNEEVVVSFDGNNGLLLTTGDTVRIKRAEDTTKLIKLDEGGFINNLREKILK
ncbi:MAG: NAD(+)/NADH kinase [Lachnospiraceae bacterium]|nr:NAD(+)/NADH kinase [Lachnospiraceae bacterium]